MKRNLALTFLSTALLLSGAASAQNTGCLPAGGVGCSQLIPDANNTKGGVLPGTTVLSTVAVVSTPGGCTAGNSLTNVTVGVNIKHNWVGDLRIRLKSPSNTYVTLFDRPNLLTDVLPGGCPNDDIGGTFDDVGTPFGCPFLVPTGVGSIKPATGSLSTLVGQSGLGTWTLEVIDYANGGYGALDGWQVNVNCLPATHFLVSAPASTIAGTPFTFTVTALDSANAVATGYTGTVHFSSSDGLATLPADIAFTGADAGVKTFTNGATFRIAGNETLTANDTVTQSLQGTATVLVLAGPATHYALVGLPSGGTLNTAYSATLSALDAFDNLATSYTGTVHFTSSDALATLPANYTFTGADAGSKSFPLGFTFRSGGTQSVTATDTVTASINTTVNVLLRASAFYTVAPCRIIDTRGATGPYGAPSFTAGSARTFQIGGNCSIPLDAVGVSANVTVTNTTANGTVSFHRAGSVPPLAINVVFAAGQTRANNSLVAIDGTPFGSVTIEATTLGTLDVIVDVNGYFK